ncbi:hypothetical protein [Myroides odoratimimus]|uniref:DUF4142 domain-containing protein n=1 Tax=Myroides odoratimimus CIP 101113 TaxID=883154 RepID=A0AAV3F7S2_9FLAO|nr:hypothetical protein [Myroides odoratimimus]EHO15533.1 hypothetical protein HMPREF9715_00104 [Myroides odoratimimus CIP 101113]
MKFLTVIFISAMMLFQTSTTSIRERFEHAGESVELAEAFYSQTLKLDNTDLGNAYKGSALITKAKFEKGIKNKKALIVQGAALLDGAVANKPKDLEIRLVRLIIQEHVPNIVKYKANIQEDKRVILENYSNQSADVKKWISSYAKQSKAFTTDDRNKLL